MGAIAAKSQTHKQERQKMTAKEITQPGIYMATAENGAVAIKIRVAMAFGKLFATADGSYGMVDLSRVRDDMCFERVGV
jgi:hypothetical protein